MKHEAKKSQVSIFIIIGIVVMSTIGVLWYISTLKDTSDVVGQASIGIQTLPFVNFVETCLANKAEEGLWLLGLQGGHITPNADALDYENVKVPYYVDGNEMIYPGVEQMEQELSGFITGEMDECLNFRTLKEMGYGIKSPGIISAEAGINEHDVSIKLNKPLTVTYQGAATQYRDFSKTIQLNLQSIHQKAIVIAEKIRSKNENNEIYDISEDCGIYDSNEVTNVYNKNPIVQIVDLETQRSNGQSFVFQFSVKGASFSGECKG